MPYVSAKDGTQIYYRDWGTGKPVVLIHGWPLNGDMWERQAEFLASNGLRVITYDRRGFGRSDQPWGGYDYDTFASDLSSLLEHLDVKGVTLVGFSMGGGEVARYLARHGTERVERAVLVAAITPFLAKTADNPEGVDPAVFEGFGAGIMKDRPEFLKNFGPHFYGRTMLKHTVSDADLEWTQMMALQASLHSTSASAVAFATTDFRADLKQIAIPVLVIHGTGDATVPFDVSGKRAAEMLSNATLHVYQDEPHGLFLTATDRLNTDLLEFVNGTSAPSKV